MEVQGVITEFLTVEKGVSKEGKEWQKMNFLLKTEEQFNNLYCFEVFGTEKVENLTKFQKVGDAVKVLFNVKTTEWKGRHFTSLQSWRIEKDTNEVNESVPQTQAVETVDDMPF